MVVTKTVQVKQHDYFVYNTPRFVALAPAATFTQNVTIQADSDFLIEKLTFQADIAAAAYTYSTLPIPLVLVTITDTGSGRLLSNAGTPVQNQFGFGWEPFILPSPKLISARSVIAVQATNFDAAVTYNLVFSFIGRKIFTLNQQVQVDDVTGKVVG